MTSYAPGSKKGGTTVKVKGKPAKKRKLNSNLFKSNKQLKSKIERRTAAGKKSENAKSELQARRKARRNAVPLKKAGSVKSGIRVTSGIKKTAAKARRKPGTRAKANKR
jgi:hypothetical protein